MKRRIALILCLVVSFSFFLLCLEKPHTIRSILRFVFGVPSEFDPYIMDASRRYGLDYSLVKAVIDVESGFDREAVSAKGAMGLMQLMPGTAKDMGVRDPFDPRENIEGGAKYLKLLLGRFNNDVSLALAAYNAGPEVVKRYGGVPPYPETQEYLKRVLECYTYYGTST